MPEWLPKFDRSIVLSITSLTVAIVSLGVAINSSLNFQYAQKINNQPELNTGGPIFSPPKSTSFVANRGPGIAIIDNVIATYDDKKIRLSEIKRVFSEYQDAYNKTNHTSLTCSIESGTYYKGMRIDAGQRVALFVTEGECPEDMYMGFLTKLVIDFLYRSMRGESFAMTFAAVGSAEEIPFEMQMF
ncbi:MAG: hypothetical protein M9939_25225 [Mesorhizobium sp.]|nr:hypothetical protein [Mesorhizobium sp.]MCO5164396.1 hypothetical protein [Mesorhizobium sp.]